MISEIGLMVGLYIVTRMFSMLIKKPDGKDSPITLILAGITILVAIFVMADLFMRGTSIADLSW